MKRKELITYLPYTLKVINIGLAEHVQSKNQIYHCPILKSAGMYNNSYHIGKSPVGISFDSFKELYKLCLIPLSEINSEIIEDFKKQIADDWCQAYTDFFKIWNKCDLNTKHNFILKAPYQIFELFVKNHYDVFNLIEKDFAINYLKYKKEITWKKKKNNTLSA